MAEEQANILTRQLQQWLSDLCGGRGGGGERERGIVDGGYLELILKVELPRWYVTHLFRLFAGQLCVTRATQPCTRKKGVGGW